MTPQDFIKLSQKEIKRNCLNSGYTEGQTENTIKAIQSYLERFKNERDSESTTNEIVKELIDGCDNYKWSNGNYVANEYQIINHWVTKALWNSDVKSYSFSKVALAYYANSKSIINYDVVGAIISQKELFELLNGEKRECIELVSENTDNVEDKKINSHLETFTDEGWSLFRYLDEKYTIDNNSPKAKYSWLFHFLKYHQMIICSKEQYRAFILRNKEIVLSRVQDPQFKYDNTIKPLLEKLKNGYC